VKALLPIVLLVGLMRSEPAVSQSRNSSPLIGSWAVDVSRLPMPPEGRPKSAIITFSDDGAGRWLTKVDIVYANGSENHSTGTATLDGKSSAVKGSDEADTAAFKMPAPNVLIMALAEGGVPASTRIYTVSADGRSLIETAVYFGNDGLPIMRTHYFARLP